MATLEIEIYRQTYQAEALQCVHCNSCCGIGLCKWIWTHIQTYFVILICIVFQFDYEQLVKVRVGETFCLICVAAVITVGLEYDFYYLL